MNHCHEVPRLICHVHHKHANSPKNKHFLSRTLNHTHIVTRLPTSSSFPLRRRLYKGLSDLHIMRYVRWPALLSREAGLISVCLSPKPLSHKQTAEILSSKTYLFPFSRSAFVGSAAELVQRALHSVCCGECLIIFTLLRSFLDRIRVFAQNKARCLHPSSTSTRSLLSFSATHTAHVEHATAHATSSLRSMHANCARAREA